MRSIDFTMMLAALVVMSFSGGCSRSDMKQNASLEEWLETHFPGRFSVVQSLRDIHPKNFYAHKHNAIVAHHAEPDAQFDVTWYGKQPDLGLTAEAIEQASQAALTDLSWAKKWFDVVRQSGLDRFSVGVVDEGLFIQFFSDPVPEFRSGVLPGLFAALEALPDAPQTRVWIDCMEDSVFRKECGEIVPLRYWRRKDSYHEDHRVYFAEFGLPVDKDLPFPWQINSTSKRTTLHSTAAFPTALQWAEKNQARPFYLEPVQLIWAGQSAENPLWLEFLYPIYPTVEDAQGQEPDSKRIGYVKVVFDPDHNVFKQTTFTEDY